MKFPVPLRQGLSVAGDTATWTSEWGNWFQAVMRALAGWHTTLTVKKTHDFGNILAQTQATTTVTISGARIGDAVLVRPTTAVNGIILDGTITADDTATIRAANYSAGAIDPASQIYTVIVFQQ